MNEVKMINIIYSGVQKSETISQDASIFCLFRMFRRKFKNSADNGEVKGHVLELGQREDHF